MLQPGDLQVAVHVGAVGVAVPEVLVVGGPVTRHRHPSTGADTDCEGEGPASGRAGRQTGQHHTVPADRDGTAPHSTDPQRRDSTTQHRPTETGQHHTALEAS